MCLLCVKEVFCLRHPLVSMCFSLTVIHAKTLTKMHTKRDTPTGLCCHGTRMYLLSLDLFPHVIWLFSYCSGTKYTHTPLQFLCLVSLYKDIFCGSLSTTGKRFLTCSNRYPDMPLQVFTSPSYVCTIYRKLYRKCWTRLRVSWRMGVPGETLRLQILVRSKTGLTAPSSSKLEPAALATGALVSMSTPRPALL